MEKFAYDIPYGNVAAGLYGTYKMAKFARDTLRESRKDRKKRARKSDRKPIVTGPPALYPPGRSYTQSKGKESSTIQSLRSDSLAVAPTTISLGRALAPGDPYAAVKKLFRSRKFESRSEVWSISDTGCCSAAYFPLRIFGNCGVYANVSGFGAGTAGPIAAIKLKINIASPSGVPSYVYDQSFGSAPFGIVRDSIMDSSVLQNSLVDDVNGLFPRIQMSEIPSPANPSNAGEIVLAEWTGSASQAKPLPIHYERGFVKYKLRNANAVPNHTEIHLFTATEALCKDYAMAHPVSEALTPPPALPPANWPDMPGLIAWVLALIQTKHYDGITPPIGGHVAGWPNKTAISDWFSNQSIRKTKLLKYMAAEGLICTKSHYTSLIGGQTATVNIKLGGLHVEPQTYSRVVETDLRILYPGFYPGCLFTMIRSYGDQQLAVGQPSINDPLIPTGEQNVVSVPETKLFISSEHSEWMSAVPSMYKNIDPSYKMYQDDQPFAREFEHVMPYQSNRPIDVPP